ncbi:MAG: glycosyltransferase family 4 protein [Actinobacteria bacterium]|nr:glycosyltransferase family 4 protein [Actinomycetota bacterium]
MLHIGINGRSLFRQLTGVQHYAREIAYALESLKQEDARFTVFSGREGRGAGEGLPLTASSIPAGGPVRGLIWEQTVLRRMARKAGVDILFNPANVAPLYPPAISVVTIHDLSFLLFPQYFSRAFGTYYRSVIPRIIGQAAAVITDSENSRQDLIERMNVPPDKVTAIHLGVSPSYRRRQKKAEIEEIRRRQALPPRFFLSVSSLEPRKNLGRLVKAYGMLPEEVTSVHKLVLVGAGNRIFADPALTHELSKLPPGSVITPGYIPEEDLPAVYRMSTALVFPSLYEGFGLPVIEAMAASTPVITSSRSSLPEVAGPAAALIDPESPQEIAAAMELIAQDSGTRNLLIERGKKQASKFTWEKAAVETLAVLKSAAGAT